MTPYRPQKIYIEKDACDYPVTKKITSRLAGVPFEVIDSVRPLIAELKSRPDPVAEGKRCLYLAKDRGRSFKPFPESKQYLSCDYYTLHLAEGCDMECSYCILQSYLTNPMLTVYVNLEETLASLGDFLDRHPEKFFRVGTGQLADSLSLDPILGHSEILVPFFAQRDNAVLELKTKSRCVENLFDLSSNGKTIVSWSMNSERVQKEEEHKCASIADRITAAGAVIKNSDHRVGFHFDPIIDYPGWEEEYGQVFDLLFRKIPEDRMAWISLGCLRFVKDLRPIILDRFPKSLLPLGEWITGMDGKMRYLKSRRIEIYRRAAEKIRRYAPRVTLYLSMETPEVWRHVFGGEHSKTSVCELLDTAAGKREIPEGLVHCPD
ncbi:MAG: hypothetical protein A2Z83_05010 [Omnitrophica bacterium GWA2_52_8]|nr:MAG: hypothetical protein A2Z83_05010 [Omnitrophica bacterium GWA2_52_8]